MFFCHPATCPPCAIRGMLLPEVIRFVTECRNEVNGIFEKTWEPTRFAKHATCGKQIITEDLVGENVRLQHSDLRKTTGGAANGGWHTVGATNKNRSRASHKPRTVAWQGGWKSWPSWTETLGDTGVKDPISKLLQFCKEGEPLPADLEALASRAVVPEDEKSDKEREKECWKN
jgi:hypothetical protein